MNNGIQNNLHRRIATVDTSNPFITRDIPTPDESLVVIRFKDLNKTPVDFPTLVSVVTDSDCNI
jgi:phosphoribulokinase